MANKKFSELAAAATLTGAEIIALVQSAASVRATLNDVKTFLGVGGKVTANIGDGSAASFTITHNLNTRNVRVEVYRNATPWDTIICDITRPTANTVTLSGFGTAPSVDQFSVIIWS
jgi:hypothetical protein